MSNYLNNDACMPLVFANGFPASLQALTEEQLECFLKYLWDFTDVPPGARFLPPISINPKTRIYKLKTVIRSVYSRLGCRYLLHLSEGIALRCDKKAIGYEHITQGDKKMVNLYDLRGMNFIVSVPRSNLTYDMALHQKYEIMSDQKKRFIQKRPLHIIKKLKSWPSSKEVINLDSDGDDDDDDVIIVDSDEAVSIKEPPSGNNVSSSAVKKSIIKNDTKYVTVVNHSNDLIIIPKQGRHKIPQNDSTVPKIEFAVTLPSDDPSHAYYISSESEPENESTQEDPFSGLISEESTIVLLSDSDSESNEPTKVDLPAKKIRHSQSIYLSPRKRQVPPSCPERSSFTTYSKDRSKEKSFEFSRNNVNIQRISGSSKGQAAKGTILGKNKTYSHIIYSRKQKQNVPCDKADCDHHERHTVDGHRADSEKINVEDKVSYMNSLGLFDKDNPDSVDDLIILPEVNKKDFMKFHRFSLNMVPYLVSRQLIDDECICPGEPGQNSYCTSTTNIDLSRRRSGRVCSSLARYRVQDRKNARDYKFPKKTFRTRPPVVLCPPKKKLHEGPSKAGPLSSKFNKVPKTNKIKKHKIPGNRGVSKTESNTIQSGVLENDTSENISKSIPFHGFPTLEKTMSPLNPPDSNRSVKPIPDAEEAKKTHLSSTNITL